LNVYREGLYDLFIFNKDCNKRILYKILFNENLFLINISYAREQEWIKLGSINLSEGRYNISILKFTVQDNYSVVPSKFDEEIIAFRISHKLFNQSGAVLRFEYHSPFLYFVKINLRNPSILVLAESFNKNWKLYYGNQSWMSVFVSRSIPEDLHFKVNGYANGWYVVPPKDFNGSLTIYFLPQSVFYVGIFISLFSMVFVITYFLFSNFLLYKNLRLKEFKKVYADSKWTAKTQK
jgi:hypothetical protein